MVKSGKKKVVKQKDGIGSEDAVRVARVAAGIFFLFLTFYTLYSLSSLFFTWNEDQSLSFNPSFASNDVSAANGGGKVGWRWSDFLFSKVFGVGAFILPVFFGAVSIVCFRIRKVNLLRVFFITLFGAVIFSVVGDYVFALFSDEPLLGVGAGGSYGHYANDFVCQMLGVSGAGLSYLLVVFLYACLISPKVAKAFDDLIYGVSHREKKEKVPADQILENLAAEAEPGAEVDSGMVADLEAGVEGGESEEEPDEYYTPLEAAEPVEHLEPLKAEERPKAPDSPEDVQLTIEEGSTVDTLSDDQWRNLYDPRLDLPSFQTPPMSILYDYQDKIYTVSREELERNKQRIVNALDSYKIKVIGISAKMGPTVTLYKIHLADGVKVAQVRNLEEDIAISLGAKGVRVVTLLDSVGIEVANERPSVVAFKAILNTQQFHDLKMELPLALGVTVTNEPFFIDLAKMPHLLVAGATGMGKSVGLNVILSSLLFTKHPAEMKLVLVDPKKVELSLYEKLDKHYLAMLPDGDEAIITDTKKVVNTLKSLCIEMEDRYALLKSAGVRQIKEYNEKFLQRRLNPNKGHKFLPYIVVAIDEFADLLMTAGREIEEPIARLAQKARAIGIHLVIATQRPTTNIITGTIKANFNSRIAFKVSSSVDSKVIIDSVGANRLIGRGDMLVSYPGAELTRVQCALIDTPEIEAMVKFISDQKGYDSVFPLPEYVDENEAEANDTIDLRRRDQLFDECAKIVVQFQQGSTSMIQRKLGIGYARAGRIMDQLEAAGIVGPQEGSKARNVLVTDFDSLDRILASMNQM
ncbi:MAG: DNA translocase FtsK 4TM domain-containing protein [Bacteroidales bacterium]|nr:DNA translocase FtsK 4TM domain-containing protein [Candidatus Cacconaster scatequi]